MVTIDNIPEEFTIAECNLNAIEKGFDIYNTVVNAKLENLRSCDPSNVNGVVVTIMIDYSYFQHNTLVYKIGNEYQ